MFRILLLTVSLTSCARYGFDPRSESIRDGMPPTEQGAAGDGPLVDGTRGEGRVGDAVRIDERDPDGANPDTDGPAADGGRPDSGGTDASSPRNDVGKVDRYLIQGPRVDINNESCTEALFIDYNSVRRFTVITAGARNDHGTSCGAGGLADVVAELRNVPVGMTMSCIGGGELKIGLEPSGGDTCPPTSGIRSIPCGGGTKMTLFVTTGGGYVVFCRNPSLPPAVVSLHAL